jgi:hypothetical protein
LIWPGGLPIVGSNLEVDTSSGKATSLTTISTISAIPRAWSADDRAVREAAEPDSASRSARSGQVVIRQSDFSSRCAQPDRASKASRQEGLLDVRELNREVGDALVGQ